MERRKFLIGAGALASGSAAAVGTGAFSTVEADRDMTINVAGDQSANLELTPTSPQASQSGDTLGLNFDSLNNDAYSEFTDVFSIENAGTQQVRVWIDTSNVPSDTNFTVYTGTEVSGGTLSETDPSDAGNIPVNSNVGVVLDPGTSVSASPAFGAYNGEINSEGTYELGIYAVADNSELYPDSGPEDAATENGAVPVITNNS